MALGDRSSIAYLMCLSFQMTITNTTLYFIMHISLQKPWGIWGSSMAHILVGQGHSPLGPCLKSELGHAYVWTSFAPLIHCSGEKKPLFCRRHFQMHFLNENVLIEIEISLKFFPKGSIHDIQTLVQIMAWRRPDCKQLSEPVMVRLLTHLC